MEAIAMFLWHLLVALICGGLVCGILFSLIKRLFGDNKPAAKEDAVEDKDDDSRLVIAKRYTADGKGWNIVMYFDTPGTSS